MTSVPPFLVSMKNGVGVRIFVQPKASKTRIVGLHDDMVKLAVAAPPVEGKANKEVVAFLAGLFKVKKADVMLISGQNSRRKVCLIDHLDEQHIRQVVESQLDIR